MDQDHQDNTSVSIWEDFSREKQDAESSSPTRRRRRRRLTDDNNNNNKQELDDEEKHRLRKEMTTPKTNAQLPRIVNRNNRETGPTMEKDMEQRRELFTNISLCMDKETAKYMPYASVSFPKLVPAKEPHMADQHLSAELENMWMVGFLDHEKRTEKDMALKDLAHFVSLPGGTLLPGAAAQIRKIYQKESNKLSVAEKRLKKLTESQRRRVMGRATAAARLSDSDMLRLKELEKTKGGLEPVHDPHKAKKKRRKLPWQVYGAENAKIRKALKDKNPHHSTANVLRSRALENIFELKREHLQAVLRIQECFRSYKSRQYWREIVKKSRAVIVIQKYVRGMITRTLVRVWLLRRSWLIILAQSCIRGVQSRERTKKRFAKERESVVLLQRVIRGYLGRIRADYIQCTRAAIKIQRLFRGAQARVMVDRMWVDKEVSKVQKIVRGFLGRKRFRALMDESQHAALLIQRNFRGILARWEAWDLMWERETERRREFIKILRAEDEWILEELERMEHHAKDVIQMDEALAEAKTQIEDMEQMVVEKEFDFDCMKRERALVDQLAIRQGWTTEIDRFIVEHRAWVTNAKFEYLFVGCTYYRQLEKEKQEYEQKMEELRTKREHLLKVRDEEVESLYERETQRKWELKRRERRRSVAQQKRRWQVTWYTEDGKIDKRKRPGYAWDPEVYAGQERQVFNIGSVNLFAGTDKEDISGLQLIADQVALQNAQNEMVQYGALMQPLFNGMEDLTEALARLAIRRETANMAAAQQQELYADEEYDEEGFIEELQ